MQRPISFLIFLFIAGASLFFINAAHAATNIYYSVGQSTVTNLETGSSTITLTSGAAVFSIAQTGNIGVGDKVTYGASSSIAYISGKLTTDDTQWSLVTATGSVPTGVAGASVTSIKRAFASLSAAVNGLTGASYLATSSLVGANAIVNLPCYYDTGPDTTAVGISSSTVTGPSNYVNIYTPNNTSTQTNLSERGQGVWTATGAYQLVVTGGSAINIIADYVRITGLQVELISTGGAARVIKMDNLNAGNGYLVFDSNILRSQNLTTSTSPAEINNADIHGATPTVVILNNIIYDTTSTGALAINLIGGTNYVYNNTVYNTYEAYSWGASGVTTTISLKNNIAQGDTVGYHQGNGTNIVDASSTDNISDHADATGTNPYNNVTLSFVSTSTRNLHLSAIDNAAIDQGTNLSADPNYAFNYDIDGQARPYGPAWDIGADEYVPVVSSSPTITSFTLPATSTSLTVPVTSFTATSTVNPVAGYLITLSSSTPSSSNTGWASSTPATFTFGGYGTSTAYAWVTDAYGNISASASATVAIPADTTPPTITSFTMPATATSLNVTVTSFAATDNVGVTGYLITESSSTPSSTNPNWSASAPTSFTFGGIGTRTAYAWAKDGASNISSSTSQTVTIAASATNVYYSVGQSTATNLETGSPTITLTSGAAVFSIAQTGNIGVGDKVTYGSGSIAYISAKTNSDDEHWSLVTATGTTPANVTGVTVTSINRAFASLNAAVTGFTGSSYLATSSLVGANAIVNIPCYYDSGPDTTGFSIANSVVTGPSNYVNIYTPNNTSTQANVSQRHQGVWTATGAYQLVVTNSNYAIDIRADYVRVTGLQMEIISSGAYLRVIRMDNLNAGNGYIVLDSNILRSQISATSTGMGEINNGDNFGATPTVAILNNIIYDATSTGAVGMYLDGGTYYVYNNTVYNTYQAYVAYGGASTTVFFKNNIAQQDTTGYSNYAILGPSSTNNLSDHADAPGMSAKNSATVTFVNTSTRDLLLASSDTAAVDQGANLSADPNYSFNYDVVGTLRPQGAAWDIGADELVQPYSSSSFPAAITNFTMPSTSASPVVPITAFTATGTVSQYLVTESSTVPSLSNSNWSGSPPPLFIFGGTGTRTAYAWVEGNNVISSSTSGTVTISTTPAPVVYSSSSTQSALLSSDWSIFSYDEPTVPFGGVRLWDTQTYWYSIETSRGQYNWTQLDTWLADANNTGHDVLYTFGGTPAWASGQPCTWNQDDVILTGCNAPPTDVGTGDNEWKEFVTAVVEHSLASPSAHIKYYELWNEPNLSAYWTGTDAQLVTMANDAYTIIHSLDPSAVVVGPTPTDLGYSWLDSYYAAGGASSTDVVSFHTYVNGFAESIPSLVENYRAVMAKYGLENKPLWSTEGSWGPDTSMSDYEQQAWLARAYLYLWQEGVARFYWYSWDSGPGSGGVAGPGNNGWGELWYTTGIFPAGVAYGQLYGWLVGSNSPSPPCYQTVDNTYHCNLTLSNGNPGQIVWNVTATTTLSLSPTFTTYQTLDNDTQNSIVGNSVTFGDKPILLVINNIASSSVSAFPTPVVSSFVMPSTASFASTTTSFSVPVTTFVGTDNSGIAGYLITSSASTPSSSNPGWTIPSPSTFTFSSFGSQTAYGWVKDSSGNISPSVSQTVVITQSTSTTNNVYYSVGQSTSTNLMTGSPTLTMTSGAGVFSIAQTGNIGVGDQVTYGASSSIAYISGKTSSDQTHWSLVTATGTPPTDIAGATVTSITRAYASLSSAVTGMTDSAHINNTNLAAANVIVNIPCYYDSGPDTTEFSIASSTVTGPSNYVSIYTPNNTSTQANVSQRHQGVWTATGAYQLVVTNSNYAIDIRADYVRITGLQMELISSGVYPRVIRMDNLNAGNGYVVLDSNIVRSQTLGTSTLQFGEINNGDNFGATPTVVILNNIVYDATSTGDTGISLFGGTNYVYNNTVYNTYEAYLWGNSGATTTISLKNNIAQGDTIAYHQGGGTNYLDASSTNNLSDHNDEPGTNGKSSSTLVFVNAASRDLLLANSDTAAIDQGANLSADPNYAFNYDIVGTARPQGAAWDIGADEYVTTTAGTPILGTSTASSLTTSTVTLNGTVTSIGNTSATVLGFNYGTSTAYGLTASTTGTFGTGTFSQNVTGLTPNALYHFQAFAVNSAGTGTSTDVTFTTASAGLPSATNVTVTGTTTVGGVLTGAYTFFDPNGAPESGSSYEWLRSPSANGSYSAIANATATTYTLVAADIGQYLEFQVTPVSQSGTGSPAVSAPTPQIQSSGPPTASSVSTTGTSTEGDTLSGHFTYTQADSVPHGVSTFLWLESGTATGTYAPIAGAIANTYALAPSDVGMYLEFQATPVASYPPTTGSPVQSAEVGPIAPSSLPVASAVGFTGTTTVGQTLTGAYTYSDSGSNPEATSTFAWLSSSKVNGSYTAINGATLKTYVLASSNIGQYLKFQVTPVSTVATGSAVASNPSSQIQSSGVPTASSVAITGTPTPGQTLTGSYVYAQADGVPEASSTFLWLESGTATGTYTAIPGATNPTYTVLSGDQGMYIEFQVTPIALYPPTTGTPVVGSAEAIPVSTPPSVAISAPTPYATVSGLVGVSALSSAFSPATVSTVEFYLDGSPLGTATWSPYTISWNTATATNALHTLYALATDDYGNTATSTSINVTVLNTTSVSTSSPGITVITGGGGSGSYYTPPTTPITTTTTPSPPPGSSITSLQAEITSLTSELHTLLQEAASRGITGAGTPSSFTFTRNLTLGSVGPDVKALQQYLNTHGFPVRTSGPGSEGEETTYFGTATQGALAAFQQSKDITPSVGYFGPITRGWVNAHQ